LVKNEPGLQECENWQFKKSQAAKPNNRNQVQNLGLQAIKMQKTLKKINLICMNYEP